MTIIKSVSLHYQDGNSDKVYNIYLEQPNPGQATYLVTFAYGRRGSTLQVGTKTISAVLIQQADKIYNALLNEKLGKGYQVSTGGPGVIVQPRVKDPLNDIMPQLLNAVDEDEIEQLLETDCWAMQEKMDGERRLIVASDKGTTGLNRKGNVVALPEPMVKAIEGFSFPGSVESFVLDGEQIGETYYAFDLLFINGVDHRMQTLALRYTNLKAMLATNTNPLLKLVPLARGFSEKVALYEKLKAENKEGVVFKDLDSEYKSGRPNSHGSQLKYKFYETASCIVTGHNTQRSVQIAVFPNASTITLAAALLPVGNVTILPNFNVPPVGAIVEIRYLYYYNGGSLYQPVYLGERTDLDKKDCVISQLKHKPNISLI